MDKNRETETGKRKSADHWTLCGGGSSEHLSVCRRAELLGRSVMVKKVCVNMGVEGNGNDLTQRTELVPGSWS